MNAQIAQNFLKEYSGSQETMATQIPQSGSARQNFIGQIHDQKYIVTYNPNVLENKAFFYFTTVFQSLNLNTPRIHHISKDSKWYIQDFLGDKTLSEILYEEGLTDLTKDLVKKSLTALHKMQIVTQNKIDYKETFEYETYNELPILHDLYYFKNFLVDVLELEYKKSTLLTEFKALTKTIENCEPKGLMIRDFQSRNIMVDDKNKVSFIDYQSAMYGPLMYDVVSFLYQAKANFPQQFKSEMIEFYLSLWEDENKRNELALSLPYLQLIRFMQVLGAYGFRGLVQRKQHFLDSLELGNQNLVNFIANWEEATNFPELKKTIEQLENPEIKEKIKILVSNK